MLCDSPCCEGERGQSSPETPILRATASVCSREHPRAAELLSQEKRVNIKLKTWLRAAGATHNQCFKGSSCSWFLQITPRCEWRLSVSQATHFSGKAGDKWGTVPGVKEGRRETGSASLFNQEGHLPWECETDFHLNLIG